MLCELLFHTNLIKHLNIAAVEIQPTMYCYLYQSNFQTNLIKFGQIGKSNKSGLCIIKSKGIRYFEVECAAVSTSADGIIEHRNQITDD